MNRHVELCKIYHNPANRETPSCECKIAVDQFGFRVNRS